VKKSLNPAPVTLLLKVPCFACQYQNGLVLHQYGSRYAIKCGRCATYQYSIDLLKDGGIVYV